MWRRKTLAMKTKLRTRTGTGPLGGGRHTMSSNWMNTRNVDTQVTMAVQKTTINTSCENKDSMYVGQWE